jgi:hypothetical protein
MLKISNNSIETTVDVFIIYMDIYITILYYIHGFTRCTYNVKYM